MSAMFAVRFGSYSIEATRPGMPSLSRLKSIILYKRLCPPPLWRVVIRPWLLRPAFLFKGASNDFSGLSVVISLKSKLVLLQRPFVVGLYFLIAIFFSLLRFYALFSLKKFDVFTVCSKF